MTEQSKPWHWLLRYLAWTISLLLIFGGAFFVFAIAVVFGNDVTYQWMTAMITAIFTSIFVTYPCYVGP